jgi:putative PIN family toxin of toxin-antitoxin system
MTVLIDTNIVLDALLNNAGFVDNSKKLFNLAYKKRFTGYVSASAVTDIFYVSQKKLGKKAAKEAIKYLLNIYRPATVTDTDIYHALDLTWDDFEDSVQFAVGESLSADYIVTRNTQDFSSSHILVVTPEAFMRIVADNV